MSTMDQRTVIRLENNRRMTRAVTARRLLSDLGPERRDRTRAGGRVWVNGSELGGARSALSHLAESYD